MIMGRAFGSSGRLIRFAVLGNVDDLCSYVIIYGSGRFQRHRGFPIGKENEETGE